MPADKKRTPAAEKTPRQRALEMLDRRDYSRAELRRKLQEKGVDELEAENAVEYLVGLGFVNDLRYAELIVRQYAAKGCGARRVREELYRRGIDRETMDAAMETMPEQDEALEKLLRQKLRGSLERADVKRATDSLLRKGYSYEEIASALRRLREEADE